LPVTSIFDDTDPGEAGRLRDVEGGVLNCNLPPFARIKEHATWDCSTSLPHREQIKRKEKNVVRNESNINVVIVVFILLQSLYKG